MLIESPSGHFLKVQLQKLGDLLSHSRELGSSTVAFVLEWLFLIVGSLGHNVSVIVAKEELVKLRKALVEVFVYGKYTITVVL